MAQTSVRIYKNSGFNAVNIPDSPALLDSLQNFTDCYAIDINQERFLPQIRISAPGGWAAVKDVDYVRVDNFYNFVDNIWMSSGDVAELTLTPDFITSAGGPAALTILDGVTDRVHVTNDTFGLYGADDPYMAPALDMDIVSYTKDYSARNYDTFVETTLDLAEMGSKADSDTVEALTAFDPNEVVDPSVGAKQWIAFPQIETQPGMTQYACSIGSHTEDLTATENQALYKLGGTGTVATNIKKGIALARTLGVEESISGQFSIPHAMITRGTALVHESKLTGNELSENITDVPFIYGTANNNRVFYGSQSPYFLTAGSGSTMSAKAEEIYTGFTGPQVIGVVDPRRTGKPYYRFNPLNGKNLYSDWKDFFRGSVAGKEWLNHPMVMNSKSGGLLEQINYANSRSMAELDKLQTEDNYNYAYGSSIGSAIIGNISALANGNAGGFISNTANWVVGTVDRERQKAQYDQKYKAQKAIDQQQLSISQNVFVPSVQFPVSPDLFSECTGNGFMVSRAVYKPADIARIDKILTAYGYKYSKVLEASDFNNRTYFNYVSGSITVGNLPRWWADGIAAQIGTGVRVWHVKPSPTYYASNPVRVVTP